MPDDDSQEANLSSPLHVPEHWQCPNFAWKSSLHGHGLPRHLLSADLVGRLAQRSLTKCAILLLPVHLT